MTGLDLAALIVAVILLGYLCYALLRADRWG